MADVPAAVNANIKEVDGAHYPVRLNWVPRIGELIDLYSLMDTSTGDPPVHQYEVVQVVHRLYDVTEKVQKGFHFITVFVKPSSASFFRQSSK